MGSPSLNLPPALARLCSTPEQAAPHATPVLPLGLPGLAAALPDGGLPRGCVSEISTPAGLAHATRFALAACVSAQACGREQRRDTRSAWCAWVDPNNSLYAPGASAAGVDLARLLVVHPSLKELTRIAVRVVASGIFALVTIDRSGIEGACLQANHSQQHWRTTTRRLALAANNNGCTVLLLSQNNVARRDRLPTALRLELTRPNLHQLNMRVVKERRGRISNTICLPLSLPSPPAAIPLSPHSVNTDTVMNANDSA